MSGGLAQAAGRLRDASDALAGAAVHLARQDPGPAPFGAPGPGRLGELGAALHRIWSAAVEARAREAAVNGARLATVADAVARAASGYAAADGGT